MRFAVLAFLVGCTGVPATANEPAPEPVALSPVPSGPLPLEKLAPISTTLTNGDGLPRGFATIPGGVTIFFSANERGLWRTDGTPAGTYLLRDLAPVLQDYNRTPQIVALQSRAYWTQGAELWSTDGVHDVTRVAAIPQTNGDELSNAILFAGAIYFGSDTQLYKSDGTTAGTQAIATLRVYSGSDYPRLGLQVGGGKLWFPCTIGASTGVCVSDGTGAGTSVVAGTVGLGPNLLGYVNGKMLFSGQVTFNANLLRALFATDGTTTTKLLAPSSNGDVISTYEEDFAVFGTTAYFPCYTGTVGFEMCQSDGTVANTKPIDVIAGATGVEPFDFAVMNGYLYFSGEDAAHGFELWRLDPSGPTAALYADVDPGTEDGVPGGGKIVVGNELYFIATDARFTHAYTLWKTDGLTAPTLVKQIQTTGPQSYNPQLGAVLGDKIVFGALDDTHGQEPWVSDGTAAGTMLLADTAPPSTTAEVLEMRGYGNAVFFDREDGNNQDLWRSDGTTAGTKQFQAVGQNIGYGAFQPTVFGGKLVFTTDGALWSIASPTATSATKILDLAGNAGELNVLNGKLAFEGTTEDQGYALYLSDGTAAGTMVTDPVAYNASNLGVANGKLWLSALDGSEGNELWSSDGTTTGVVADIYPGTKNSSPGSFAGVPGTTTVVFGANDGVHAYELWKTDGTSAGTSLLADLRPGAASGSPFGMTSFKTGVLFWASNGAGGNDLWTTDGTAAGTVLVKAIGSSWFGSPLTFVVWGGHAFFVAQTPDSGAELWRTDGTPAGTVMVTDLYAGALSSSPSGLVLATPDGPLLFAAEEPVHGRELYRLDDETGTPTLAAEVATGTHSSSPTLMTVAGPRLFFVADDNTGTGPALFSSKILPDAPPDGPPGTTDGGGSGSATGDGGNPETGGGGGGGCCSTSTDPRGALVLVGLVGLGLAVRRRRR